MVIGGVEGKAPSELVHLNAALLSEKCFPYEDRGAIWRTSDVVEAETDVIECDMIVIKTVGLRFESVVVSQRSVVPVETAHFVDIIADVDIGLSGHESAEVSVHVQRVTWQVESEVGLADGETVRIDAPLQRGGCRIGGCRITEGDVQTCLLQSGSVHLNGLFVEIDTF